VARRLWDVVDSASDGESSDPSDHRLTEIVDDGEDDSLRAYHDQGCRWSSHGYATSDVEDAASNNDINDRAR
jgi:hypothetical protein